MSSMKMWRGNFSKCVLWFFLRRWRALFGFDNFTLISFRKILDFSFFFLKSHVIDVHKIICTRRERCFLSKVHQTQNNALLVSVASSIRQTLTTKVINEDISPLLRGHCYSVYCWCPWKKNTSHTQIISRSNTHTQEFSKWYIENTCFAEKANRIGLKKQGRVKASPEIRPAKLHRTSVVHWCIKRLCSVPLSTLATLQSSLRNHQNSNTICLHSLFCLLGRRHLNPQLFNLDCKRKQNCVPI